MKIKFTFLLLTIAICNVKSQTTISLNASQDAAIGYHDGANTANNNYGYAIQNAAYCIPATASIGGLNVNRALIDFNLSVIPAGAVIISANLNLYAIGPFGSLPGHTGPNNTSTIERITQSWQENLSTWNNQPSSTTQNAATLIQSTSSTQNYLNINVTALVQDMQNNPSTSFGFKLRLVTEATTNSLAFASKDHSNPSLHPSLTITYSLSGASQLCNGSDTLISDYDAAIGYHDGANTANNNYGTAAQNAAYAIPATASIGGLNVNRALIHFDLSSIPANATITNALMDLYAYGPAGSYPGHAGSNNNGLIERVTGNWTENTVTWNNQPTSTSVNHVPLAGTTNATLDYLNINVTPVIQDIFTASVNNGVILKLVTEAATNLLFFCSEDHPNIAKHPRLRVTYVCAETAIQEKTATISNISTYPNPATNIIYFNFESSKAGKGKIVVMDIQGKQINEVGFDLNNKLTNNVSINTESLKSGIYFYTIQTENEHKTGKFIIE